ncbi:Hpt domain-containing protein [Paracoccus isoporae]|uniref:Hpt domain-containing protein n=1 Tax=Paracoccus isoporae TaxID=591205 RepID=A0A1G6Z905_9RHOB|nr:Hpt domain-containing protein [Paracoccus isoporae]SDD99224.1 Hpt domain-containing protein [Paracoccus isoporae]
MLGWIERDDSGAAMIDWNRVEALREELGEADFAPVAELFLDEIESTVMRICQGDAAQMETDFHFLKGCAANLGFSSFAEICQQGEAALRAGGGGGVALEPLLECYAATKREFIAGQAQRRSGVA